MISIHFSSCQRIINEDPYLKRDDGLGMLAFRFKISERLASLVLDYFLLYIHTNLYASL